MPRIPLKVIVGAGVSLLIVLVAIVFGVTRAVAQLTEAPVQPIEFSHAVHVQGLQLECVFCHRTAAIEAAARVPSVEQCMFCHSVVGKGNAEIEKVRSAWDRQQPINWVRVHRLPDHVHFVHSAHIQSGVDCSTCHGRVQEMARVRQVRALNMGDCVGCHRQNNAATECGKCHY